MYLKCFIYDFLAQIISYKIWLLCFFNYLCSLNYDNIDLIDDLKMEDIKAALESGVVKIKNLTKGTEFEATVDLTEKEIAVIKEGGRLNYVKANS